MRNETWWIVITQAGICGPVASSSIDNFILISIGFPAPEVEFSLIEILFS